MIKKLQEAQSQAEPDGLRIEQAVSNGKALMAEGTALSEVAMAIYRLLEGLPRDTIVAALMEGMALSELDASTYRYHCRRKVEAERRRSAGALQRHP